MTEKDKKDNHLLIINHYGKDNQISKLTEEAGEFLTALARSQQYTESYETKKKRLENLKEETADLRNMLDQFLIMQGDKFTKEVQIIQDEKIRRTLKIIEKEQNEHPF